MEDIKKELEKISTSITEKNDAMTKAIESKANAEDIKAFETNIDELKKKQDELNSILIKQGEAIADFQKKAKASDDETSLIQKALNTAKEKLGQMKAGVKSRVSLEINTGLQQKSSVVSANVLDTTISTRVAEIGEIPYRRRFLEDLIRGESVGDNNGNNLVYTDQANVTRSANNVAEASPYPTLSAIDWREYTCKIEKIADSIKVSKESMDDFDFVESEVRNLLISSVDQRVDQQLLLGTGVSPELKGIALSASTFVAGDYATTIKNASLFDLIHVIKAQIMTVSEGFFMANVALMNPVDVTKLLSTKDADGNYVIAPFATDNGRTINGVRIVENTLVPAGEMYVMDSNKATIYNRKTLTLDISFDNEDDFNKDMVSIKASRRLALLIRNVNANAFMHVPDIAAAITAITQP